MLSLHLSQQISVAKSTCFLSKDTGRRSCSAAIFYALSFHPPYLFPFYQSLSGENTHYFADISYLFCLGEPKFLFSLESILGCGLLACLHPAVFVSSSILQKRVKDSLCVVQMSSGQEVEHGAPCSEMSVPDAKYRSPFSLFFPFFFFFFLSFRPSSLFPDL